VLVTPPSLLDVVASEQGQLVARVDKRLQDVVMSRVDLLTDLSCYLLNAGGKRIRPRLVITIGSAYGAASRSLVDAGAAVELIHLASLIHDDVVDDAPKRRGRPAVHVKWTCTHSILAGDYLFAKAFELVTPYANTGLVDIVTGAIQRMCEGEIEETSNLHNYELTESTYLQQASGKTGALIGACCQIGAVLGGASTETCRGLMDLGMSLGVAFQIVDDILDFTGSRGMGKAICKDIKQGVCTLPLIRALADPEIGPDLSTLVKDPDQIKIEEIISLMRRTDALEYSHRQAARLVERAKGYLQLLPCAATRRELSNLADFILRRSF